ncbi:NUDIX domain-containing protein [Patescibacteria group bacterium]|nr:NUDIX domain-containing protein [Patescibacteria group bacterium]
MKNYIVVCGIVRKGSEFLLGKKKKYKPPYPDVWHSLGGYVRDVDRGYTLVKAKDFDDEYFHEELRRELKAQANIEVENIASIVPEYRRRPREAVTMDENGEDAHYIFLEYMCDYAGGKVVPDENFEKWEWHHKDELKDLKLTPPSREMYVELGWDWLW